MVRAGGGSISRYPQSDEACEAYFVSWMAKKTTLSKRTIAFYREGIHAVIGILKAEGLQTLPHHITEDDVRRFLDAMQQRKLAVSTRKDYMSALKKYCTCFNNNAPNQVEYKLPQDTRPRFYPKNTYLDGAIEKQLPAIIFGSAANAVFFATKFGVLN